MRYPKDFYNDLKKAWEKNKTELQQRRKEIDAKRDEFYQQYYIIKNGIQAARLAEGNSEATPADAAPQQVEGSRPKQNRERKAEREKIDAKTTAAREEFDSSQPTWPEHYTEAEASRKTTDAEKLARLNTLLAKLEETWNEYRDLVKKYHRDYYDLEPTRRKNSDTELYEFYTKEKTNYQQEFDNQIEQDKIWAAEAWQEIADLYVKNDIATKKQRAANDEKTIESRRIHREQMQEYNHNYYSKVAAQRLEADVLIRQVRQEQANNLKQSRQASDDFYQEHNTWSKYRQETKEHRKKEDEIFAQYFSESFANLTARLAQNYAAIIPNIKHGIQDIQKFIKANWDLISIQDTVNSIRSFWTGAINSYTTSSNAYLNKWYKSIPELYIKAKDNYAQDVQQINTDYNELSKNTSSFASALQEITADHLAQRAAILNNRGIIDAESTHTRAEFFAEYDSYIKNFFNTRRASRAEQLQQRIAARNNADLLRAQNRKIYLQDNNNNGALDLRAKYDAEIKQERENLYQTYADDIETLRENNLLGYARNKSLALRVRKGWHRISDYPLKFTRLIGDGFRNFTYILQDIFIPIGRFIVSSASFAYYAIGSGAYAVHILDRYLIRNLGFLTYDLVNNIARRSGDLLSYTWYGLKMTGRFIGLALYKIPLFYALKRGSVMLAFALHVASLPLFYGLTRTANFLFKCVYFPALIGLGIITEFAARLTSFALSLGVLTIATFRGLGVGLYALGSLVALPIRSGFELLFLGLERILNSSFIFLTRSISDILYLAYTLAHNIFIPLIRAINDIAISLDIAATNAAIFIARKLADFAHELNVNLYQNILLPLGQSLNNGLVSLSRLASDLLTGVNRRIASAMFAVYVGFSIFKTRIAYALGIASANTTYYGGRLVINTSRFLQDRYHGAGSTLSDLIPAAKETHKGAIKAGAVVSSAATNTARAAEDYIGYPVSYALQKASTSIGRRLWDGALNVWRGTQDVCTYGIRSFHNANFEIDKRVSPTLINFGRVLSDKATDVKQTTEYAGYKAHEALQRIDIAYILEHDADAALKELRTKDDNSSLQL